MKKSMWMFDLLGASLLCACYGTEGRSAVGSDVGSPVGNLLAEDDDDDDDGEEGEEGEEQGAGEDEAVALSNVPQAAKDAAIAAVPGLVLTEAEQEGADRYCLHGMVGDVFYEIEVDSAGHVVDIESGDEDED